MSQFLKAMLPEFVYRLSYLELFWGVQTCVAGARFLRSLASGGSRDHRADDKATDGSCRFHVRVRLLNVVCFLTNGWVWWKIAGACFLGYPLDGATAAALDLVAMPRRATTDSTAVLLTATLLIEHTFRRLCDSFRLNVFSDRQRHDVMQLVTSYAGILAVGLSLIAETDHFSGSLNYNNLRPIQLPAICLYFWASRMQHQCYVALAKLRKNRAGHIVTTAYRMPNGDLFDSVSSPQYLSEALVYVSLGLVMGTTNTTWWIFVASVVTTQLYKAHTAHAWYLNKFSEYPKDRKIILPYVW